MDELKRERETEKKRRKKKLTLMSMNRLDWGVRRLMFIVFYEINMSR